MEPAPVDSIGQLVRQRRHQLNLSQAGAAHRAGIARRTWYEIELDHRRGSDLTLTAMEKVLGLEPGTLTALHVAPKDDDLAGIRRELVRLIGQLTTREELEQARLDLLRRQYETVKAQLAQYEAALHDPRDG